jgi:anaerobic selenocysteine-containing dehydrogenase
MDMGRVSQENKVAGREPVRIRRSDAMRRGIRNGDVVCIFNDRGATLAGAVLSDDLRSIWRPVFGMTLSNRALAVVWTSTAIRNY